MSNNARKTALPVKATLCQVQGHDWQDTASPNVMICARKECRLVKQKVRGHWRHTRKVPSNVRDKAAYAVNMTPLWNEVLANE